MGTKTFSRPYIVILVFVIASLACQAPGALATATPLPTATATATATLAPTSTATKPSTRTPRPTSTPNVAATQKAEAFNAVLKDFFDKGYISTTEGRAVKLRNFKEEWAQIGYFRWWDYSVKTKEQFVFKAHFNWSTASSTPDPSGCGVVFGIQENGDYYVVFLAHDSIRFRMNRGENLYSVGKTSGKGTVKFGNPAESDFVLAVNNGMAYVSVDGEVTSYTLSVDQTAAGNIAMSLRSGTNRDYGTRCEMTDLVLWQPK